jgi:hypothetical protein
MNWKGNYPASDERQALKKEKDEASVTGWRKLKKN